MALAGQDGDGDAVAMFGPGVLAGGHGDVVCVGLVHVQYVPIRIAAVGRVFGLVGIGPLNTYR